MRRQYMKPGKIKLPSGKILSSHYTDQDILNVLGNYEQGAPYPASADWEFLIVRYDEARYASLNPARQALFNNYVGAVLSGNNQEQDDLVKAALDSDQPLIDYETDMVLGGNGPENASPGTLQAQRRFAYGYTSGPAYSKNAPPPTIPPSGPIVYTLVPPPPYVKVARPGVDFQPAPYAGC